MGKLDGKVAFVTGAGHGQGRSHAITLAKEGADVIAVDIAEDISSIPYALSTKEELDETAQLATVADVRDFEAIRGAVASGVAEFGDVDIVVANAGVIGAGKVDPTDVGLYRDIVNVNLNGVWHTIAATAPSIISKGRGGSIGSAARSGDSCGHAA